uniref:Cytochrome P450 n=1 Tax=Photinus pyralis TaxID=7054 RepID=A0A1Y1MQQ1_PHOPY
MGFPASVSVQALLVTAVLLAGAYLYRQLHYRRFRRNAHIPQLPPSLLWGHLLLFDKYTKQGIPDRHPDAIISEMHEALGKPPIMLLDNWPIVPPMVVVANHEVAEQVSRSSADFPYSVMKSPSVERIVDLIGPNSILLKQNERWKAVRKRFNPGFAPQHLMTLLPVILEKAQTYLEILDHFANTGESFSLDQHTTNLTFDIIGIVTMGEDVNAQQVDSAQQGELIKGYKELIKTYADDKLQLPWWLMPRTHLRRRLLGQQISNRLKAIVSRNFEATKAESNTSRSRSILALSLQDVEKLTPDILAETSDQLKTFLFAGHDTTSTLIIWTIYELSRTPHALKAVRDELERLLGRETTQDPTAITQKLLGPGGDEIIHQMTYISAVLKEVLRLYAPAGSIRISKPNSGLVVSTSQGEYNLDGNWIYLNHYIMHRDRAVYGDTAEDFVPERWLKSDGLPPSVWRPFERGPRNCIGMELANIEARAIVALFAHRYAFEKVGLGELDLDSGGRPRLNDKNQYATKSKLYITIQITGKPVDGMMVKVRRDAVSNRS